MVKFVLRKNQRFEEMMPVRYCGEAFIGEGIVRDLSLSGALIAGMAPVSAGMALTLHLFLPDDPEQVVIEHATVQWVRGATFGVDLGAPRRKVAERITKVISDLVQKEHGTVGVA